MGCVGDLFEDGDKPSNSLQNNTGVLGSTVKEHVGALLQVEQSPRYVKVGERVFPSSAVMMFTSFIRN